MAKVLSINISEKKGEIKIPIKQGEFIKDFGLKEDSHAAAWHRQVSLLAKESIDYMQDKSRNVELNFGDFAENITTEGVTLHKLPVGTILEIGQVILKVSQIGKECHSHCNIYKKMGDCIMPREGIFAEVLKEGCVQKGDIIKIIEKENGPYRVGIITVSDRASKGEYEDKSGPVIKELVGGLYLIQQLSQNVQHPVAAQGTHMRRILKGFISN